MASFGADVAQQPRLSLAFPPKEEDVGGKGEGKGRKGGKGEKEKKGGNGGNGGRGGGGGGGEHREKNLDFL